MATQFVSYPDATTLGGATEATLAAINAKTFAANAAATFAQVNVSTVQTLTAPAGAVGFLLAAADTNTTSFRWCVGGTASASNGLQMQPGRDSGYIPCGVSVSVCAESGTCEVAIQWVRSA